MRRNISAHSFFDIRYIPIPNPNKLKVIRLIFFRLPCRPLVQGRQNFHICVDESCSTGNRLLPGYDIGNRRE